MTLDAELASRMARIALGHVQKEYPHKLDHVLLGDEDALPPRVLHPIFYGSFDWHSCVHAWWTLLTLRRLFPEIDEAAAVAELASRTFTQGKVAGELAYLERPLSRGFERPYGYAWLLYLHLEASRDGEGWAAELEPLARAFAERLRGYLEKAQKAGTVRRDLDLGPAIDAFTGMLLAGMLRRTAPMKKLEYSQEDYVASAVDLFVRGIAVPAKPGRTRRQR